LVGGLTKNSLGNLRISITTLGVDALLRLCRPQ
jgi:hypothetical protein